MNWFEQVLGKEWKITPAGGLTGDAYVAENQTKRLFLKRNSSPFLAVLSAEKIVPKLVWTKRLKNGDVITAQEWLDSRELKREEMQHPKVADLLYKIHHSSELLHMLMRLGKKPVKPEDKLKNLEQQFNAIDGNQKNAEIQTSLTLLHKLLPVTNQQKSVVCHGDLNHNNLLLTKEGKLFLIDWENTGISDPVVDFSMILKWYIPINEWENWLKRYGVTKNNELIIRMYWYLIADALHYYGWHLTRNEQVRANERLSDLPELNEQMTKLIQH